LKLRVIFVGAGPGDPDLITLKGKREIELADVVIYAGSLINRDILKFAKKTAILIDSSKMNRTELFNLYEKYAAEDKKIVRIHSGDLSFYSAIQEQIDFLAKKNIEVEIVPGVSSFAAASAALRRELTQPNVAQTLIITRPSGQTGKPESEAIKELAKHRATMIIFLGVRLIEEIISELKYGYEKETPAAVVYKASWKDEKIITGTLKDISEKVKAAGITRQAIIIVGDALTKSGLSKLYGDNMNKMNQMNKMNNINNINKMNKMNKMNNINNINKMNKMNKMNKISIFSITLKSYETALKIKNFLAKKGLNVELICSEKISLDTDKKVASISKEIKKHFQEGRNIIGVLPLGILIRSIEPMGKERDPWVICIDERGRYVISVLNGHRGANKFSKLIAEEISAQPVITTKEE
jgi:precorrin-4/cobalt-precorrin-4 C11-methyltransferase